MGLGRDGCQKIANDIFGKMPFEMLVGNNERHTMKPTLSISANATPGIGGQGLNFQHMLEVFAADFDVSAFGAGLRSDDRGCVIPPSFIAEKIGRIPLVRRLRDWQHYFSETAFDAGVARKLARTDLFQGVAGQCLRSLQRAKELKARTVVDAVNPHAEFFYRELAIECAHFGIRTPLSRNVAEKTTVEYETCDVIRVMSRFAMQTFVERGVSPEKIVVAHPPIQIETFPQATFSESVFRVAFVGLIEPWKGFHYLVDAFNAMREPDRELVFWGGTGNRRIADYFDYHMRQNPRIKIRSESVRGAGFNEVYGKASVLVLPSLAEGFGLVAGEAMASGIPVIVTSCTGAADLVEEGVNGYVVPVRDSGSILDRLNLLATSPGTLKAMGRAAAERVKTLTLTSFKSSLVPRIKDLLNH
ncbi:MAG: glycosyltransferase family 4 protein [Planctomycetota bacterium]